MRAPEVTLRHSMSSAPSISAPARAGWLPLGAFILCTLIWGSTWIAIKFSNDAMPPLWAAGLRFGIATLLLLPVQWAMRIPGPRTATEWNLALFVGVALVGLDYGLIYWGEQYLESGLTAVLFSVMTLLTAIVAALAGLERLTVAKLGGIVVGIGGVAILMLQDSGGAVEETDRIKKTLAAGGIVVAALCSAMTTVGAKRYGKTMHPVALNTSSFTIGTVCLLATSAARGEAMVLPSSPQAWGSLLYLSLGGSVAAFLLYFWLLKRWDASRAGLLSLLTPVLALFLGAALRNERVTPRMLAGSALVLGGVFVASRFGAAKKPE